MKVKIHNMLPLTLILGFLGIYVSTAQSVISVGSGSYAAQPPSYEYIGNDPSCGTFEDFATNSSNIDVIASKINDPIPTNDWWTSVLTQEDGDGNRLGGNLWTYPLLSRFTTGGFEVGNRQGKWNTDVLGSRSISVDYLVTLKGASFTPTKTIATNWSDWHVDLRAQVGDDASSNIEVTLAQGMPFVWSKTRGFIPIINAVHAGVRSYYDASGSALSFPATTDRFIIEYDGNLYGIHLSQTITISEDPSGLILNGCEGNWVVFSALNTINELNTLHEYAFVRPTDTKLNYTYNANEGKVITTHSVTTDVITGSQTNVLQGFIPHHYRGNANQFSFISGLEYVGTPRGTLKLAAGNNLSFDYEFNADILPHFNAPKTDSSDIVSYDEDIMKGMIDGYAGDVEFYGIGGGTYWGGKYLLRALKYTLMAKETNNENYSYLVSKTKELVHDWLTFTPGETENY